MKQLVLPSLRVGHIKAPWEAFKQEADLLCHLFSKLYPELLNYAKKSKF